MSLFHLKIVTPNRVVFDSNVTKIVVRTINGDVGILKGHINFVAPLFVGAIKVMEQSEFKIGAISGGLIKVSKTQTVILTPTFEWVDEIDVERANRAKENAIGYINNPTKTHTIEIAELKLKKAINRINISSQY